MLGRQLSGNIAIRQRAERRQAHSTDAVPAIVFSASPPTASQAERGLVEKVERLEHEVLQEARAQQQAEAAAFATVLQASEAGDVASRAARIHRGRAHSSSVRHRSSFSDKEASLLPEAWCSPNQESATRDAGVDAKGEALRRNLAEKVERLEAEVVAQREVEAGALATAQQAAEKEEVARVRTRSRVYSLSMREKAEAKALRERRKARAHAFAQHADGQGYIIARFSKVCGELGVVWDYTEDRRAWRIDSIKHGSAAAKQNLERGMVLLEIGEKALRGGSALSAAGLSYYLRPRPLRLLFEPLICEKYALAAGQDQGTGQALSQDRCAVPVDGTSHATNGRKAIHADETQTHLQRRQEVSSSVRSNEGLRAMVTRRRTGAERISGTR